LTALGNSRGAPHGGGEPSVTPTAHATLRRDGRAALVNELGDQLARSALVLPPDLCAERYFQLERGATPAMLVSAFAAPAGLRLEDPLASEFLQGAYGRVSNKNYAPSIAPITPVRASPRHKFLAPKTHAPCTSGTTTHSDRYAVDHFII